MSLAPPCSRSMLSWRGRGPSASVEGALDTAALGNAMIIAGQTIADWAVTSRERSRSLRPDHADVLEAWSGRPYRVASACNVTEPPC